MYKKLTLQDKPSDIDLAWAAGFIDGEASIGIYNMNHFSLHPLIQVGQVDPKPLLKLQRLFGHSVVKNSWKLKGNERRSYNWKVTRTENVELVLKWLRPFIVAKSEQADICLNFIAMKRNQHRPFSPFDIAEQESYAEVLRFLKTESFE